MGESRSNSGAGRISVRLWDIGDSESFNEHIRASLLGADY
jgi:hypothetical protein